MNSHNEDLNSWFGKLRQSINTDDFFNLVPLLPEEFDCVKKALGEIVPDYVEFLRMFGWGELCRQPNEFWYSIRLPKLTKECFGSMKPEEGVELAYYFQTGSLKCAPVATQQSRLYAVDVYGRSSRQAKSFGTWFHEAVHHVIKSLEAKGIWSEILSGPPPFSDAEKSMVAALQKIEFEKVGVSADGKVQIRVTNRSEELLRRMTVGVLVPNKLQGAAKIDLSSINPGETKVVESSIYPGVANPKVVELFRLPLPKPSDRRRYSEFK